MDKKQRYIVPPKMSKSALYGGLDMRSIIILFVMFLITLTIVLRSENIFRAFYWFAVPVVYAAMVWRIDDYCGADFFRAVIHYYWTPQTYVLTTKRKERADNE